MSLQRSFALLFAWTGCVVADVEVTVTPPEDPPPAEGGTFGVLAQPRLGTVIAGTTSTAAIVFAGVHERPGYRVDIQVLEAPVAAQRWVTIASATTGTTPSSTDAATFEWAVTTAPAQLSPARWRQGGLLRVRAIGAAGEELAGLFHDADACLEQHADWRLRAERCGAMFASGVVVVSPADVAASNERPRFLDRRGTVDPAETALYYQTIAAPATLTDFRARFGFDETTTSAVYYNAGDLGIGREMRCQPQPDGGLACAVSNYGEFGGDMREALDRTVDGALGRASAFATVAMVYQPPADAPNSVQFIVYGASGALATEAQLDTVGDNLSIPSNCLNCHGSSATYDAATHQLTGPAAFLPFDPNMFVFSTRAGFTAKDQAPALARLNQLARGAAATPSTRELVDGWYPNGIASPASFDFVPAGWTSTPLDRKLYQHVVADGCRNCHASQLDAGSFSTATQFRASKDAIVRSICTNRNMPNAQVPLQHLWAGPARAYLAAYFELPSCDPPAASSP